MRLVLTLLLLFASSCHSVEHIFYTGFKFPVPPSYNNISFIDDGSSFNARSGKSGGLIVTLQRIDEQPVSLGDGSETTMVKILKDRLLSRPASQNELYTELYNSLAQVQKTEISGLIFYIESTTDPVLGQVAYLILRDGTEILTISEHLDRQDFLAYLGKIETKIHGGESQ